MSAEELNVGAEEASQQKDETQAAQPAESYATKTEIAALTEAIRGLQTKVEESGSQASPTDQEEIDRLYDEISRGDQPKEADADPATAEMKALHTKLDRQERVITDLWKTLQRDRINSEYRAKYPDWKQNEEAIWKFAQRQEYRTLGADDVYALWKLKTKGPEGLTQPEKRAAADAAKVAEEAQRASSEKPTAGTAGKTREYGDIREVLEEEYDRLHT